MIGYKIVTNQGIAFFVPETATLLEIEIIAVEVNNDSVESIDPVGIILGETELKKTLPDKVTSPTLTKVWENKLKTLGRVD